MGKIKKSGLCLLVIVLIIFGLCNISTAEYKLGDRLRISYLKDYAPNKNMFCVEKYQGFGSLYKVVSKISINGTQSKDYNNKTIDNVRNAKLAYILSAADDYPYMKDGRYTETKEGSVLQQAVWVFEREWMQNVGQYHYSQRIKNGKTIDELLGMNFITSHSRNYQSSDRRVNELISKANEYANNIEQKKEFKDNTNKDEIKINSYEKNDKKYLIIGDFNWSFGGKLKDIKAYDQDNKEITGISYIIYEGTTPKEVSLDEISSGKSFCIAIPTGNNISSVKRIAGVQEINNKAVDITFLESVGNAGQNLIIAKPSNSPEPIEISFDYDIKLFGNLKVIKVDEKNNEIKLSNVGFKIKNNDLDKFVKRGQDGAIEYVDESKAEIFKTDTNGEISIDNLVVGKYTAYETENPNYGYEIVNKETRTTVTVDKTQELKIPNTKVTGNLKVIKVDRDNNVIKLQGVKFILQNKETKKYVNTSNNEVKYVDTEAEAEVFETDANGEFTVKDLIHGTYIAKEKDNPNNQYEIIQDGIEQNVEIDKTAELKIPNTPIFVDISGYVWVDKLPDAKDHPQKNQLFRSEDNDPHDILLDGITVRLMRDGKVVKDKDGKEFTATTGELKRYLTDGNNGHGEYLFENVPLYDENDTERKYNILDQYYVEFEYDGLTYQNVNPAYIKLDKGSKAIESEKTRTEFNNSFAVVEGGETDTTGITKDLNGNVTHKLSYTRSDNERKTVLNKGDYPITATTANAKFRLKEKYDAQKNNGQTRIEIRYVNLGLDEREMPDIHLEKDLENVELSINGFHHVYKYASKNLKDENEWDVGVRFGDEFRGTYKRAVYTPDYNYTLQNKDKDNKLNVYLTYRIALYNESTDLVTKVNSIIDYYDNNFTIEGITTGINKETGELTGDNIQYEKQGQQGEYSKAIIYNDTTINSGKTKSIYVRFKLNDEEVLKAINDESEKVTYKNIAEVNSYSVYDKNGNVYAGIDKDSAPANATPGVENTYEDDAYQAPGIQLGVQGDRTITGNVFFDESKVEAQIRLGDGVYDPSKEHGISGVKVTLTEVDEGGNAKVGVQPYTAETGKDGSFTINNFIPGNYVLTYTWGDTTYTVKDYKATIWTAQNKAEKDQNGNNWYKVNTETRYSDAMDNWETRQKIDNGENITTIDSSTPIMSLDYEVNSIYSTVKDVDRFVPEGYEIKNIDFGIVERAKQQLDISKKIKTFKAYLGSQLIVDAEIDDNGNLKGSTNNLIYMKPSPTTSPSYGKLWLQLDSELMSATEIQIGYEISVINNSEKEYITEDFYKYGIEGTRDELIKIKPEGVYDYLDGTVMQAEDQSTDTVKNGTWEVVSKEEYNKKYEGPTLVEKHFLSSDNTLTDENGNVINVSGWEVAGSTYQEIYTEWATLTTERRTVEEIRNIKLANKTILHNEKLEQELAPGDEPNTVSLITRKKLANSNEIDLNNNVEITEVSKKTESRDIITEGRDVTPISSNFYGIAQEITITPPTGENNNYIPIIATIVSALVLLGVGVVIIKRKTL